MRLRDALLSLTLLAATAQHAPAFAAEAETPMAAHRASYVLKLATARGADITGASGKMGYEIVDACDGWASRQRLDMTISNRDGQDIQMVSDYATWESKDGLRMTFRMRQTTEQAVTEQVEGTAELAEAGGKGRVHYTVPEDKTLDLPAGTLFPMAHTEAIIRAAAAGKKFVALPVFDGTGQKGAQDSSIAIAGWLKPEASPYSVLAALPSTRVRIAFFDHDKGDQRPDYEVGMRYWANGIADDLNMDFGDFVMQGTLSDLTLPAPHC
jgi:hypothetical protein